MLPQAVIHNIQTLAGQYRRGQFTPMGTDHTFLVRAAEEDPTALVVLVHQLCVGINSRNVDPADIDSGFRWLADFASRSALLREEIKKSPIVAMLEYFAGDQSPGAIRLSDELAVDLPRHYFDVCRQLLSGVEVCTVIIGAGFSYSSAVPLLAETKFLATHVL